MFSRCGRSTVAVAVAAVIAAATVAAHAPAWRGVFVYDDLTEIGDNPGLRTLWPPWVPMLTGGGLPHRPLPYYSFALNIAAGGLDTRGFFAVNLVIHLVNGLLLARVLASLMAKWAGRRRQAADWEIAAAGTAIWLVHPLAGFCVDYLYQRMELMAATATLAAVACFLRATEVSRPAGWLAGSVIASGLGMLCKENAVAVPAVVLLVDWLVVSWKPDRPWGSLLGSLRSRPRFFTVLFATPLLAIALVLIQRQRYAELGRPIVGPLGYLANQPLVILGYLRQAAWPDGLCLDRFRAAEARPLPLAAGLATLGAAVSLAMAGVRSRPALTAGVLIFLALLAPTSSLVPVYALAADQRMYLPLAVPAVAVAAGFRAAARRVLTGRGEGFSGSTLSVAAVAIACIMLGTVTFQRAGLYTSRLAIWQDVTRKAPENPRGWQTYGLELLLAGRPDDALDAVDRSLLLEADEPLSHLLRAHLLLDLDRPQAAIGACERVFRLDPPLPGPSGRIHPRHGIRYAILAAALAAAPPPETTEARDRLAEQVRSLLERAEAIDGRSPETAAIITRARRGRASPDQEPAAAE